MLLSILEKLLSMAVEDDNDVHVNACCLMKQLQSLLWAEVGYDVKIIELQCTELS